VPFFVIDQKYGVSGAQPVDVFTEAIRRAAADRPAVTLITTPGSTDDAACGPDGCAI
jgi:hypothetical protein